MMTKIMVKIMMTLINKILDDDDHECPGLPIVDEAGGEVRGGARRGRA